MLENIIGKALPLNYWKMLKVNLLSKIFVLELIIFGLIITGILPREASIVLAIGLAIYVAMASIEDSTIFFIMSIPLFIAIPFTANFDNFNVWRVLSIILFLKLAHITGLKYFFDFRRYSRYAKLMLILLVLAVLSVIPAVDKPAAITRIIYFVNLSLVGMVIHYLCGVNNEFTKRLVRAITVPVILVTAVGFIQVISTYFIDIYQFMRIWGEGIQMRQFGRLWSEIAVRLGNTWFAYYGSQLSLRVFSLFPDSHSFPQFVLLGLPAIFAVSILKLTSDADKYNTLKKMVRTRVSMNIVWVAAGFLIAILSGTRGIWAASAGVLIIIGCVIYCLYRTRIDSYHKNIFSYTSLYMSVFFLLFAVAYPVFVSPQFLLSKGDWGLFGERIKSIVDFGETSNSQRIDIWTASLQSIKKYPVLGVGIGNFPVVLKQNVFLARAGSSAHNIYLHIAAEMGIPALLIAIWLLWLVFKKSYQNFISSRDPLLVTYFAGTILFVPWVLIYSLTDVALFDERTFLLFIVTISIVMATRTPIERISSSN